MIITIFVLPVGPVGVGVVSPGVSVVEPGVLIKTVWLILNTQTSKQLWFYQIQKSVLISTSSIKHFVMKFACDEYHQPDLLQLLWFVLLQ